MKKTKKTYPRLSRSAITELAMEFRRQGKPPESFWAHIHWLQRADMCPFSDDQIRVFLDGYKGWMDRELIRREEYEESLPNEISADLYEGVPRGRVSGNPRPQGIKRFPSPISALKRGGDLYKETVLKYGWIHTREEVFHPELNLRIDKRVVKGGRPVLFVGGNRRPCIWAIPSEGLVRADDIVNLMMSSMFNEAFVKHIAVFDPDYPARHRVWLEKMKGVGRCGSG